MIAAKSRSPISQQKTTLKKEKPTDQIDEYTTDKAKELVERIRAKILEQRTREAEEQDIDTAAQETQRQNTQTELSNYKRSLYELYEKLETAKGHLAGFQHLSGSIW